MFNNWMTKGLALTVLGVSLTACQVSEDSSESIDTNNEEQEEVQTSLREQGYEIMDITSYDENVNVVTLEKDGETYFGTIDDNFEWLMEPTSEFNPAVDLDNGDTLEFTEGLAAVSVPETRKMRLADKPNASLWGFINAKGEWVVEPIYREVEPFSNGLAVAYTVEEDRDDLSNARLITIDQNGNEVAEILNHDEGSFRFDTYQGDYVYSDGYYDKENDISVFSDYVVYDKEGKYINLYDVLGGEGKYFIAGDKIISFNQDTYPETKILDFNGNVVNDSITDTYGGAGEDDFVFNEFLAKNSLFKMHFTSGEDVIFDTNGNAVITQQKYALDTGYADGLIYDHTQDYGDDVTSGTFYDLTGKEMFSVKKMVGPLYSNNRYFVEGKEYYKLVDVEGNTLIDESMKITDTAAKDFHHLFDNPAVNLVKIKHREDSRDTEPKSALLNIETLEVIEYEELLY